MFTIHINHSIIRCPSEQEILLKNILLKKKQYTKKQTLLRTTRIESVWIKQSIIQSNHMIRKGIDNVRLGNSDKWEHDYCNSELFEG